MAKTGLRFVPLPMVGMLVWLPPAASSFAQAATEALKQADAKYRAGTAALARNDLQEAQKDFAEVVRLSPRSWQGHSSLGGALLRMGRAKESVPEFERTLVLMPGESSAQLNLAIAEEQLGEPLKELAALAKFEATDRARKEATPAYVDAMYVRALVATHQLPAAVARMKREAGAAPKDAGLQDNLGSLYAMQKDWPDAEQSFRAALADDGGLAVAHLHLGLALRAQGRSGGDEELREAYRLAPDNGLAALELGRAQAADGGDAEAIPLLQRAVELMPKNGDAAYQLALALQRVNRTGEAIPLFERALAADPGNANILMNFGMAYCQQQRATDGVPLLQKALGLAPANPTARQNLAAAYIQLSQFQDAVDQLQAALKLLPDSPQLHYNLGLAYKSEDNNAAAIPELRKAARLDPSAWEPLYLLGVLDLQNGQYADAAGELKTSLKLHPDNGDGWATLGSVYSHLEQLPEATAALQEAIERLPGQPDPHLTLATVLAKQSKMAEAAVERRKAAELMRGNMNRQRAEVACSSGKSLLKGGKVAEAVVEFQSAIGFDAGYVEAHLGLAEALDRQGKTAEAAAERQRATVLQAKPGS